MVSDLIGEFHHSKQHRTNLCISFLLLLLLTFIVRCLDCLMVVVNFIQICRLKCENAVNLMGNDIFFVARFWWRMHFKTKTQTHPIKYQRMKEKSATQDDNNVEIRTKMKQTFWYDDIHWAQSTFNQFTFGMTLKMPYAWLWINIYTWIVIWIFWYSVFVCQFNCSTAHFCTELGIYLILFLNESQHSFQINFDMDCV